MEFRSVGLEIIVKMMTKGDGKKRDLQKMEIKRCDRWHNRANAVNRFFFATAGFGKKNRACPL